MLVLLRSSSDSTRTAHDRRYGTHGTRLPDPTVTGTTP